MYYLNALSSRFQHNSLLNTASGIFTNLSDFHPSDMAKGVQLHVKPLWNNYRCSISNRQLIAPYIWLSIRFLQGTGPGIPIKDSGQNKLFLGLGYLAACSLIRKSLPSADEFTMPKFLRQHFSGTHYGRCGSLQSHDGCQVKTC